MTVSANQTRKTSQLDYDQAREVAKELKEADSSLLGKGMCCIVDFEDLRQLINSAFPEDIQPGSIGKKQLTEDLGLRESSLETIEREGTVPVVFIRIKKDAVEEVTLAFYILDRSVQLPEHQAFPEDDEVRRRLSESINRVSEWLD